MLRKNYFYICLILIYLLYLSKDSLFKLIDNKNEINNYICNNNNLYYEDEYKKISNLLNIEIINNKIIYSKIISRDIYGFYDKVIINKGSNNNIKKGDIVINEKGLIGLINKVNKNSSEVKLITNSDTSISVKINNSYGILKSKNNKLYVENIKLDKEINIEDKVYTSGLTDIPEGIIIGAVSKVNKDSLELEYIIDINSSNNFNNIKYVGVITS